MGALTIQNAIIKYEYLIAKALKLLMYSAAVVQKDLNLSSEAGKFH